MLPESEQGAVPNKEGLETKSGELYLPLSHPGESSGAIQLGLPLRQAIKAGRCIGITRRICGSCGEIQEHRLLLHPRISCLSHLVLFVSLLSVLSFLINQPSALIAAALIGTILGSYLCSKLLLKSFKKAGPHPGDLFTTSASSPSCGCEPEFSDSLKSLHCPSCGESSMSVHFVGKS